MKNVFGGTKISKPQKDNSKISKMMGGLAEKYKGQASGDILKKNATAGMGSKGMGSDNSPMSKSINGMKGMFKKKKSSKKSGFKGFKI
jgi:hypothetical protein